MSWTSLHHSHPYAEELRKKWTALVGESGPERLYHSFLAKHAGMFLVNGVDSWIAISKLKLGSEFEIDFAIPRERGSDGLIWELIELEKPSDAPYTEKGDPSAALNHAMQQIRDWRSWLKKHRSMEQKMFCSSGFKYASEPQLLWTIVIGNRTNSKKWLEKRNQLARENGIRIRSFESLADPFNMRCLWDRAYLYDGFWDIENPGLALKLAFPFNHAITDREWKRLAPEKRFGAEHFHSGASRALVEILRKNTEAEEDFFSVDAQNQQK